MGSFLMEALWQIMLGVIHSNKEGDYRTSNFRFSFLQIYTQKDMKYQASHTTFTLIRIRIINNITINFKIRIFINTFPPNKLSFLDWKLLPRTVESFLNTYNFQQRSEFVRRNCVKSVSFKGRNVYLRWELLWHFLFR